MRLLQSLIGIIQEDLKQEPDYIAYLAYVMLYSPREDMRTKVNAGHQLKNNLDLISRSTDRGVAYTKRTALLSVTDPSLRCLGVCIIASLLLDKGPARWLEGVEFIVAMLNDADTDSQDVSYNHVPHVVHSLTCSGTLDCSQRHSHRMQAVTRWI